jgi:hypothetical protein
MRIISQIIRPLVLTALTLTNIAASALAQEVTIPDPNLNAAIRETLGNQLTNITFPPELQQLIGLFIADNPLTTFVLSEPLAATGMASQVESFRNQGISVFTYPLVARLVQPLMLAGSFKFGITGPPGVYSVLGSTNLATWSAVGVATNPLGSVIFHDVTTNVGQQRFYVVRSPCSHRSSANADMKCIIRFLLIALTLSGHAAPTLAQEVSIPDPGLNAAIRDALQKPSGPLTQQDLLSRARR